MVVLKFFRSVLVALWVKTLSIHVRSSKAPEIDGTHLFVRDDFSLYICPEAQGHFCMLWGEHGHGGYDSTSGLYVQGGQPMDEIFELAGFYIDFNEAKANGDWQSARKAAMAIRDMRTQLGIDKTEEKLYRKNLF